LADGVVQHVVHAGVEVHRDLHGFEVSPSRISQLRREFQRGWSKFCGDSPASDRAGV
jgi:hypothetical protein